jgi:hypothetical protein
MPMSRSRFLSINDNTRVQLPTAVSDVKYITIVFNVYDRTEDYIHYRENVMHLALHKHRQRNEKDVIE